MSSTHVSADERLLEVDGLTIEFQTRHGPLRAIDDISFSIRRGEVLGIVGESGAGKSLTGAALTRLMPPGARIIGGSVRFDGRDITHADDAEIRALRGRHIATIFQDPLTSLNPLYTVGHQLVETMMVNRGLSEAEARKEAVEWLRRVGLPAPEARVDSYPHEFSGGMRQRVVIALALCTKPKLVIADEPTTALDVSIQAQIIRLLRRLSREEKTAMLLITHDMGVISEITDRVAVLYLGRIVETGPTEDTIKAPEHPYTRGLMNSIPRLGEQPARLPQLEGSMPRLSASPWQSCAFSPRCAFAFDKCLRSAPRLEANGRTEAACFLPREASRKVSAVAGRKEKDKSAEVPPVHLSVTGLTCRFDIAQPFLKSLFSKEPAPYVSAVEDVSFHIRRSQTFALVGESGCGKSTIARLVAGLTRPTRGEIALEGVPLSPWRRTPEQVAVMRKVQMVFQDPYSSLNPRWNVGQIIREPILVDAKKERDAQRVKDRVVELLKQVGLAGADSRRYPHAFSGGQRQRISIARALSGEPGLLVCDEPTSALDVSVQAQILNLMKDMQRQHNLTMLFISHDLAVVNFIADVVAVMYLGRLCEIGTPEVIFERPLHPYTRLLRDAVPDLDKIGGSQAAPTGEVPSPLAPPPGCRFNTRCPFANERCRTEVPRMKEYVGSWAACHGLEEGRIEIPSSKPVSFPKPFPDAVLTH